MQTKHLLAAAFCATVMLTGCSVTSEDSAPQAQDRQTVEDRPASAVPEQPQSVMSKPSLQMTVDTTQSSAVVRFATANFKLSPEHYNGPHIPGEGHIHLFVDGSPTRIGVKGETYELKDLAKGKHKLRAALHTNNHQPYDVEDNIEFEIK